MNFSFLKMIDTTRSDQLQMTPTQIFIGFIVSIQIWIFLIIISIAVLTVLATLLLIVCWVSLRPYVFLHVHFSPFVTAPTSVGLPILPSDVKRYLRKSPVQSNLMGY